MGLIRRALAALTLLALALAAWGYAEATRTPIIAGYTVRSAAWPLPPLRIAHLSDTHAILPDMPPARLGRIVEQVNALRPDIIVLTGDYVADRAVRTGLIAPEAAVAPFGGLRARLGVYAVLGNHDMNASGLADRVTRALRRQRVTVLRNDAARAGRFWVAGADDNWWGVTRVTRAIGRAPSGAPVLYLVHNPDALVDVPPRVALTLAGHTHGGQIALPGVGPLVTATNAGARWARGHVVDRGRHMVVSAGLGASLLPLRIGVPPEIVLVTLTGSPAPR